MGAACNRIHEFGLAFWRRTDGVLESDVLHTGDFGRAQENTAERPLSPAACPGGNPNLAVPVANTGARLLPVYDGSGGPASPTMYEPWRVFLGGTVLGDGGATSISPPDVFTVCRTLACTENLVTGGTGSTGSTRSLNVRGSSGVRAALAGTTGELHADPFRTRAAASGAGPGRVRQLARSDADADWAFMGADSACGVKRGRFESLYACTHGVDRGEPGALDGAVRMPS
jgi:hypothetical protein